MMWLRRCLALFLALIFIIILIPMLVIFRVNATVGNPNFYTKQLRQDDTYNFIYDKVLPASIEEASTNNNNSEIDISALKSYIASMVEQTVSRAWLQTQVEQVITAVLPYVLGDTNNFQIQIPLKDRVGAFAQSLKNTLHQEGVFSDLYDQAINFIVNKDILNLNNISLSKEQSQRLVKALLQEQWLLTQIDGVVDNVIPYLTTDKEHFTVHLDMKSRLDDLEIVINDILIDPKVYNSVLENILVPSLKHNVKDVTQISADVILTGDDIAKAAEEIFPLEWYQSRVADITMPFFAYFKGTQPTLELALPLSDRKPVAVEVLSELVNKKAGKDISANTLPSLNEFVNKLIPDQLMFNDTFLGGSGVEEILSEARKSFTEGETYTDADLRASMGVDYQKVEDIRQDIAKGIVFTDKDLRNLITPTGDDSANTQLQNFDYVRLQLGTIRRWMMVAWLVPVLILVAIGALGARKWTNKLIWGASVLAATSLLLYVLFGTVFSAVVQPEISKALSQAASQTQGLQALIAGKGVSMAQNAINSISIGIIIQAIILLIVSLAVIIFGIVWNSVKLKVKSSS